MERSGTGGADVSAQMSKRQRVVATDRSQTGVGISFWYQSAGVSVCKRNSGQRATGGRSSGQQVVEAELRANQEGDGDQEGNSRRGRRQKTERTQISWKGDGSPENEASRGRETDRRGREISSSEVGQQGGVARHCSRAASQGQAMPGGASQDRPPRRRSTSQGSVARRCSRATSQGQAAQGKVAQAFAGDTTSQGSSLLSNLALIPCQKVGDERKKTIER